MRKIKELDGYELWFEINSDTDTYDFWLRKKGYGVMMFCIGLPTDQQTVRIAIDIAKENMEHDIEIYKDLYESEEE